MNKLEETLIILKHFDGRINGRIGYCKRNENFDLSKCVESKLKDIYSGNFDNEKKQKLLNGGIARECADKKLIMHSFLSLNIIDIFSFNDEYKNFNESITDDKYIASRIREIRIKNKIIRKKIDWEELKKFRNIGLAHNLRDKSNDKKLSLETIHKISHFMNDLKKSINYSEIIGEIYKNIENEFEREIHVAYLELKSNIQNKY